MHSCASCVTGLATIHLALLPGQRQDRNARRASRWSDLRFIAVRRRGLWLGKPDTSFCASKRRRIVLAQTSWPSSFASVCETHDTLLRASVLVNNASYFGSLTSSRSRTPEHIPWWGGGEGGVEVGEGGGGERETVLDFCIV